MWGAIPLLMISGVLSKERGRIFNLSNAWNKVILNFSSCLKGCRSFVIES